MSDHPFHAAPISRTGRKVVGRLLPGADLVGGLEAACDEHGIRYAAVLFAYGSLARASFKILQRPEGASDVILTPYEIGRRVEFLGGQGLVCRDPTGERATHLHGSVSDETGMVHGGHFNPGQNPVYNNMDFLLEELLEVELVRAHDPATNTVEMEVRAERSP